MKISRTGGTGGAWIKKEELRNGDVLKLVSEAGEVEGANGTQLVAKCRIKGQAGDAMNMAINSASRNALIDAFGDDTKNWVDKHLTVEVEKGIFAGKRGIALYLVPEGFSVETDSAGYVVITRDAQDTDLKSTGTVSNGAIHQDTAAEDTRTVPAEAYTDIPF